MKKKYRKFIYLACFVLILIIVSLAVNLSASVSVKDCDDYNGVWGDYETYEFGYNIHGVKIFKHPGKALKQFKKDYTEGFQYLRDVRGYPELTTSSSYKVASQYFYIAFGPIKEGIENHDEVEKQVYQIMFFMDIYENSYWQKYTPFY